MPITRNSRINGASATDRANAPATPRQIAFLQALATDRNVYGDNITAERANELLTEAINQGLTKTAASNLIGVFQTATPRNGTLTRTTPHERPANTWTLNKLRDFAARRAIFGDQHTVDQTITLLNDKITAGLTEREARDLLYICYRAPKHRTPDDPVLLEDIYTANPTLPRIDEGYYALEIGDAVRFFRVWTPSSGNFRARLLIARYSSDRADVLMPADAIETITAIATDPLEAATRFARLEVRCYVCGKRLTDHISRILLQGPDCRGFTSSGPLRPLRNLPDTEANQDIFTGFLRSCMTAAPHQTLKEAMYVAAEWFAALPDNTTLQQSVTRLTALMGGGYTAADTITNPELWTCDERRLQAFATLRNI